MAENIQLFILSLLLIPFIGLFLSFMIQQNAFKTSPAAFAKAFATKVLSAFFAFFRNARLSFTASSAFVVVVIVLVLSSHHDKLLGQNFGIVGSGTTSNGTQTYPAPYGQYYWGSRQQFFVSADELSAAGVPAGARITSLGFNVITDNGTTVHTNFQVIVYRATNTTPINAGYYTSNQLAITTAANYEYWSRPKFTSSSSWK
jgi:hypothetical protein